MSSVFFVTQTATVTTPVSLTETNLYTISVPVTVTETDTIVGATITTTAINTDVVGSAQGKRGLPAIMERQVTVVPTNIPQYALGPCGSIPASYSYACSCIGATASTITVAAPSTTITIHTSTSVPSTITETVAETQTNIYSSIATTFVTVTTTTEISQTTIACDAAPDSFYLRISNPGGQYDGKYLNAPYNADMSPVSSISQAALFGLDASSAIYEPGAVGVAGGAVYLIINNGKDGATVGATDENTIPPQDQKVICSLDPITHELQCSGYGQTIPAIYVPQGVFGLWRTVDSGITVIRLFADCS